MPTRKAAGIAILFFSSSAAVSSELSPCPHEKDAVWSDCYGTSISRHSVEYSGEFQNGERNGRGTATFPDGGKYVGEWKDDVMHGQGTVTWPDGSTQYTGQHQSGEKNGYGVYQWKDGQRYAGQWKDDVMHGQGTLTWPDGRRYVGQFKDYSINGQGSFTWPNGKHYVGQFKDELPYGQGTFTSDDGTSFIFFWETGEPIGTEVQPDTSPPSEFYQTYKVASGTGFFVSEDGHIITNDHVIDGCKEIKIHSKGEIFDTVTIANDPQNDLALLKSDATPDA